MQKYASLLLFKQFYIKIKIKESIMGNTSGGGYEYPSGFENLTGIENLTGFENLTGIVCDPSGFKN